MKVKKITITASLFVIIAIIATIPCFFAGCSKESKFYGTYNSIFVDSQNDKDSIQFKLTINKDNTFELSKSGTKQSETYKGTWKSYTESKKVQLLCCVEEGFKWNDTHPNAWNPYFTLALLDDGTVMATPGSTFGSYVSTTTAFGYAEISYITLILFEKA